MKLKKGDYVFIPFEERFGYIVGKRKSAVDREETIFKTWYHVPSCSSGSPVEWYLKSQLEFVRHHD